MGLYLDYNASTPINDEVLDLMVNVYKNDYGNADSRTHIYGSGAKGVVEKARGQVAELLKVKKNEIIFTSGSTESNNLAILGLKEYGLKENKKHIITTTIEHKSVLEPVNQLAKNGFEVEFIHPHQNGRIDAEDVVKRIRKDTLLVSVMHVNNETGTIQPVEELGEALRNESCWFHIDASQSCGKLVKELQKIQYDLLSLSAHKMYGPQGVGALIIRFKDNKKPPLEPIMYGGGQEGGMRPGTLPVALIAGLGLACDISLNNWKDNYQIYKANQKRLLGLIEKSGVRYTINGDTKNSVGNTLNISFDDIDSEVFMLVNQEKIGVSNGSACTSSYKYKPSYVLQEMGIDGKRVEEAIRISWGNNRIDFDEFENILEWVKEEQGISS